MTFSANAPRGPSVANGPLVAPRPSAYAKAERAYLARSLAELAHERLVVVTMEENDGSYANASVTSAAARWTFRASRRRLDFFHVDPESIRRDGSADVSVARFFVDMAPVIGMEPFTLARFVEETNRTLFADACIRHRGRPSSTSLADGLLRERDGAFVERSMEGHPWVLVNKGRMGWGAADVQTFAPESGRAFPIEWVAVHTSRATATAVHGTNYDALLAADLGDEEKGLRGALASRDVDPTAYHFVPVHPWQLQHVLAVHYARDFASQKLVHLGPSIDDYLPQQSIRTFRHAHEPERHFLKTALSILNTGQIRGLSPEKMRRAPAVTTWLRETLDGDPEWRRLGTVLLGEVATVTCAHEEFSRIDGAPYQYREFLGALLREPAVPRLAEGEALASMASLLYVDDEGRCLIGALAERGRMTPLAFVERYLAAYLTPILHCFYAHELFFVAHGENTVLVLENGVPRRVILKDLVEEVQVSREKRATLPEGFRGLLYDIADELIPLFFLTDIVDGFFRYLADVLVTCLGVAEDDFWRAVARTVLAYQEAHPELAPKFAKWDLFVPTFPRFCLNKYRLVLFGYADVADNVLDLDPKFDGVLENPIAPFAPKGAGRG